MIHPADQEDAARQPWHAPGCSDSEHMESDPVQEQKTESEIFALDLSALYKKTTLVVFSVSGSHPRGVIWHPKNF
jgi:hypothetical protein